VNGHDRERFGSLSVRTTSSFDGGVSERSRGRNEDASLFVRRPAVDGWDRDSQKTQVDAELRPMMNHVVEKVCLEDKETRLREDRFASRQQRPWCSQVLVAGSAQSRADVSNVAVEEC
jgi:hypothetical protein